MQSSGSSGGTILTVASAGGELAVWGRRQGLGTRGLRSVRVAHSWRLRRAATGLAESASSNVDTLEGLACCPSGSMPVPERNPRPPAGAPCIHPSRSHLPHARGAGVRRLQGGRGALCSFRGPRPGPWSGAARAAHGAVPRVRGDSPGHPAGQGGGCLDSLDWARAFSMPSYAVTFSSGARVRRSDGQEDLDRSYGAWALLT